MSSGQRIVINADDLGYNIEINKAIIRSFELNLISRASIMVNMPGFADAVELVNAHPSLSGRIGLHFNLTEGYPLSMPIRDSRIFCDSSGQFIYKRRRPLLYLSGRERQAVYGELKAQIDKAIQAGIRPNHLDSHHHVHTEWAILKEVIRLGRRYGVLQIRLTRNMGNLRGIFKPAYKLFLNGWLKTFAGSNHIDRFGDFDDLGVFLRSKGFKGTTVEIMVHPSLDEDQKLVDLDGKSLEEKMEILTGHYYTLSLA